jgi:hypothetical protein
MENEHEQQPEYLDDGLLPDSGDDQSEERKLYYLKSRLHGVLRDVKTSQESALISLKAANKTKQPKGYLNESVEYALTSIAHSLRAISLEIQVLAELELAVTTKVPKQ